MALLILEFSLYFELNHWPLWFVACTSGVVARAGEALDDVLRTGQWGDGRDDVTAEGREVCGGGDETQSDAVGQEDPGQCQGQER